jgi:metal-sulfur cluster biosynthetic enzyme
MELDEVEAFGMSDDDILSALTAVIDPELGINIVDLGLVYRAERIGDVVAVRMTMTTPSCPLGEMLLDEVRAALHEKYPQAAEVSVELVWDPPWSAELMSPAARRQLGVSA